MNANAFRRGIAVALLLATVGASGYALATPLIGIGSSARLLILGVVLGGISDLLLQSRTRTGRIVAAVAVVGLVLGLLAFDPPLITWCIALFGAQWLLRALLLLRRPMAVLVDAAATIAAVVLAIAVGRHSGSVWLALWCLLLLQTIATAALLPAMPTPATDRFAAARRSAESALRTLLDPQAR